MIEPHGKPGEVHGGWQYWWQVLERELDRPQQVAGFICPARFRAVGLDGDFTFSTRLNDARTQVVVDSIRVDLSHQTSPQTFPIPLGLLLKHALIASGARGLQLPPNWQGSVFSDGLTFATGDQKYVVIPTSVGRMTRTEQRQHNLPNLIGRTRPKRVDDDLLRQVAEAYRSASRGDRYGAVQDQLLVSKSTARNYIRRARDAGILDDVPDNDKRKARRK
jgi:hypothetical protein